MGSNLGRALRAIWGWAIQRDSGAGHSLLGSALQGDSGAAHSGDSLGLGTLHGDFGVGHSRETLGLGGWALRKHSGAGHSRETLELGSKNTLELGTPGHFGVGHRDEREVDWARRRVPGEEKSSGRGEELSLKSNSPTPRVGNNRFTALDAA